MIIGSLKITSKAVITHRNSYVLEKLSVVSVERPFLAEGFLLAGALGAFGVGFYDLLYPAEKLTLVISIAASLGAALQIGRLSLLSRDLKGSAMSGAIWGQPKDLQQIRQQIADALLAQNLGEAL